MRKLLLIIAISITPYLLKAQLDTFDLSSYKLPDIKTHRLDLNFDMDGSNSKRDSYQRMGTDYYSKSNSINGNVGANYNFYRNSYKYQGNQNYLLQFNGKFRDDKDRNSLLRESNGFQTNYSVNSENRFYLNNKLFFESNLKLYGNYYSADNKSESSESDSKNKRINIYVPIGIGIGRVEQVQDSWLAIYILDELNKNGKLTRIPTHTEVIEFSEVISALKKERFFDARLQKIKEIEKVDSFLQTKGLIDIPDSRYFTIVNDNWDHAAQVIRNSGTRFSFKIESGFSSYTNLSTYESESYSYEDKNRNTEYGIRSGLYFVSEKPINIYWQRGFNFNVSGGYLYGAEEDVANDSKVELQSPELISEVNYSLDFYPNTRTSLNFDVGINFLNSFGEEEVDNQTIDINHFEIVPSSNLSLNYYISPQLLFNINYRIYYRYMESNSEYYKNMYDDFLQEEYLNQNINIGFIYKLF
ncbi:MAG: hypothetical protein JEY96_03690 [Bacteroidales bacterium]|nr:hypothetical protein [Bacteroidales bacterium]